MKKNHRPPRRRKNVSPTDDAIRDVPYIAGLPREPFPQLKSRQARNYRRELEAIKANEEYFELEESVFLLYRRLQNARKEGDSEAEAQVEVAFKQQIARYTGKNFDQVDGISQEERSKIATVDLSDFSLLNVFKGNNVTVPSIVITEDEPFTDDNGQKFFNSVMYNPVPKKAFLDTLNLTFLNNTGTFEPFRNSTGPVVSTPLCAKQTKTGTKSKK